MSNSSPYVRFDRTLQKLYVPFAKFVIVGSGIIVISLVKNIYASWNFLKTF